MILRIAGSGKNISEPADKPAQRCRTASADRGVSEVCIRKTVISYVKGALAEKSGDRIVVEAGPVGLGIYVPLSVLEVSAASGRRSEDIYIPSGPGG